MATKDVRQKARRAARDMLAEKRRRRADVERERDALATKVMIALAEKAAVIEEAELRAGTALNELVATGLTLADATSWCDGLSEKEAIRLSKAAVAKTPPRAAEQVEAGV